MAKSIRPSCACGEQANAGAECELYREVLTLCDRQDLEPRLEEAFAKLAMVSGAAHGFVELRDDGELPEAGEPGSDGSAWSTAYGFGAEDVEGARDVFARGIVMDVIVAGSTIESAPKPVEGRSVAVDPSLPAVLCTPIRASGVTGVVYLDRAEPFAEEDRMRVEIFARLVGPVALHLIERGRHRRRVDAMRELRREYRLEGLIGRAPALAVPCRQAMRAAGLDIHVLLTGASGTGKSQLARLIHDNSGRASGPFVELNCATLPENLIESELFGSRAGSHSQATRDVDGKVAAAENGTLFLDEIAELPTAAQAKLLQLIQSRDYYQLGSSRAKHADVRIIAATNVDLAEAVSERRFREDLYFRLHVMPIRLPTLGERRDDVPLLATEICSRVEERHRLPVCELSTDALRALRCAEWPGNVRQLANVVEAGAIRAATEGGGRIEPRHVFPNRNDDRVHGDGSQSFHDATRDFQRRLLTDSLEATGWNVSESARRLGLARSHVYNLIHSFGLCRRQNDGLATLPIGGRQVTPARTAAGSSGRSVSFARSDAVSSSGEATRGSG